MLLRPDLRSIHDSASRESIGGFLLRRLRDLGLEHVFGVAGDYNLELLEQLEGTQGLEWVGCCNELNAAYAADGYARTRGLSASITTYGVGELSALCGVAGAELSPRRYRALHLSRLRLCLLEARSFNFSLEAHVPRFSVLHKPRMTARSQAVAF